MASKLREDEIEWRDKYLFGRRGKKTVCLNWFADWAKTYVTCSDAIGGIAYQHTDEMTYMSVAMRMEINKDLLAALNDEVRESRTILEDLANQVIAVNEAVEPALIGHIKRIREARMTAISEIHQSLAALKEVRKFFFESDYGVEMARLKEFVALCKELQELKKTGILDAVSDIAIRLAIKEESK